MSSITTITPASFAQQRLWFLERLEPGSAVYHIPMAVRLSGALDRDAVVDAFRQIVARHETLRTTFAVEEDEVVQVIHDEMTFAFSHRTATDAELRKGALTIEAQRPFDLTRGPLLRVVLWELGAGEHVLQVTLHHIIADGWSRGVLIEEFVALYRARLAGEQAALPELSIQYADFAAWQRDSLQGDELKGQLGYWRGWLAGAPALISLPTDYARPAAKGTVGGVHRFEVDADLTRALHEVALHCGSSLFMVLLAGFAVLLQRLSGQSDLVIGTPVAGRTRREIEPLIGFFVNTLALRLDLSGNPTVRTLLERVRGVTLDGFDHQDVPFQTLVQELQPERTTSHTPIFQVMFVLQNAPAGTFILPGLEATAVEVETGTTKYDLTIALEQSGDVLAGQLEYDVELFDASTAVRLATGFIHLLQGVSRSPHTRLGELEVLDQAERARLVTEWNATTRPYPECSIATLFAAQAVARSRTVAVKFGSEEITYAELDARANRLARVLIAAGVKPDTLVPVCLERSIELIVALVGIIKSGGAYVALDPEHPPARLATMLEEVDGPVLLTREAFRARLPGVSRILCLDKDWPRIAEEASVDPGVAVGLDHLAYVSYTSGSTGKPKGVAVPHRGVLRLVINGDCASFGPEETFLQLSPVAFDASTYEIWGALLSGGKLVVPEPGVLTLEEIGRSLRQDKVTSLFVTTGLFHLIVDERLDNLRGLRQLLTGGEVLSGGHICRVLREIPTCRLIACYGPTENTTFTTCHPMGNGASGAPPGKGCPVPIGRPIANTQVYVLDERLEVAPVGVPGELYIGGDGLARGYLCRPELTAERFVPDPFSQKMGARLYRSGDRARWRSDGVLEFVARSDRQLKIRGFRVEPAEIEAALLEMPGVKEAVAVARENGSPGEYAESDRRGKRLIGYVVRQNGAGVEQPDLETLRRSLGAKLPDYMVPARLIDLPALPLKPNGKVDHSALPVDDYSAFRADYIAPQSDAEKRIAAIWGEVLRIDQIGRHDNFFTLGGHSLLATQVVSRMSTAFGIELPLRRLFESPTVASLADRIADFASHEPRTSPISRAPRNGDLPLSFAQERLWFLHQLEPDNPFYNVPSVFRLSGEFDVAVAERVLNEIFRRHEVLRTRFVSTRGEAGQVIANSETIRITVIDLQAHADPQGAVQRFTEEEARRPFDLERGPLLRATLLHLEPREHVLLMTLHHIVSDGWSMGVLAREMSVLYEAFSRGQPSPLLELAIQYADFTVWQRQWLSGSILERQLSYWKERFAGAPAVLKLPTDRPRALIQRFRGSSHYFEIDATVARALGQLSERFEATMFMTLQAAFAVLLSRYSGQEDVVIGSPIANRTRAEIEPLIGFFVNTLALRTDLSGEPSFSELLERVRTGALDAFAHQDLPFEKLVDELQPERDLSRNPIFQVMFALQNAPAETAEVKGLALRTVRTQRISAQFDMVLDVWETDAELQAVLEYDIDLFDASTIERMAGHFQTLLAAIAAEPNRRISQLPLLSEAEKKQLLFDFNDNSLDYPADSCLHQVFEEQADATPERVCIVHRERSMTFGELNAQANRIAHLLRAAGVPRNEFVGILAERGIDFLAAMLGVLKAGAAFVPIDPAYPADRVRYMIANSAVSALITELDLWEKFRLEENGSPLRTVLCPEESRRRGGRVAGAIQFLDAEDLAAQPAVTPANNNVSSDLAYMLYTAGSTGSPKGAMVRHNGAVNHIWAEFHELCFHSGSVVLQSAPSSSDISLWQFLAAPLSGGRTVVADFEVVCDPAKLFHLIRAEHVSVVELVPVVLKQLLDHVAQLSPTERALTDLEWAMVTGESVPVSLVNEWFALYPAIPLVNAYGPTEAADDICQAVLRQPLPPETPVVPIGRPLSNLTLYVVDRHLQLQPMGVPGEICVSGVGVGTGYWRKEQQTRESFVPNPFGSERGAVMYRTGDLGRWRDDGTLEMLGRLDQQVKLRGFRIELGEIESVVDQHPAVRECAVLLREDVPDERRLVAYITPDIASGELEEEQVALWRDLHEESYADSLDYGDPTFNVIGWDSNYTGQPLPRTDMEEYVGHTAERVLSLQPHRVLEIGCGTGLLLFRIAPHCERYVGTDLSRVAMETLARTVRATPSCGNAELLVRRADDFEGIQPGSFDLVMLCSVVQYFPTIDYLLRVLGGAARVLRPGGAIFLGDVRNLQLLEVFHTSVQLFKAGGDVTAARLRQRIQQQLAQEQELALDPAFFATVHERIPQLTTVAIEPKRGLRQNEMTRFRYDVTLRVGRSPEASNGVSWSNWKAERFSFEDIRRHLQEERPRSFALERVGNSRVERELKALTWLKKAESVTATVNSLRAELERGEDVGIDPEKLLRLGDELGYKVRASCSLGCNNGSFDVVFQRRDAVDSSDPTPGLRFENGAPRSLTTYANNPLREKLARRLVPPLRTFVKTKLPAYLVPSDFMVLETFPLLPSGKLDRQALPAPNVTVRGDLSVLPGTPAEKALAAIWTELLDLEHVDVRDNFFELGGHSLKATQLVSRVQKRLGVELPLRDVFRLPTIAELAREIEARQPRACLGIERVPDAPDYPMSHAQQRIWVLSQTEEGSVAYNMPGALLLEGAIDLTLFARAFELLVERHESLRTTFRLGESGEPRQVVHAGSDARVEVIDLSEFPDSQARARRLAAKDAMRPFDLERGPLVRMTLAKLSESRHALIFNIHHIVSDDWSMGVLVREFARIHESLRRGPTVALRALPIQYRDYAAWQERLLASENAEEHRRYWLEKFGGEIPAIDLPTDFPRPPLKSHRGRSVSFKINHAQTDGLLSVATSSGATLFMALTAIVKTLLHRYTGQQEIIVGFAIAGRDHADLEGQIGFYVNTLPLRDKADGTMSFLALLSAVRDTAMEAYEHQAYPFDRLVSELTLPRDTSRSPLFDVLVVEQNVDPYWLDLEGIDAHPFDAEFAVSKFDLSFYFTKGTRHIDTTIVFNPDLFLDERIERMRRHMRELIASVLTDATQPIDRLNLLTEAERRHLLHELNSPSTFPRPESGQTLVSWFQGQATSRAEAVAVVYEGRQLTYRELDAKATQVACYLQALGVRHGTRVGLFVERSLELVVGLIGILKAGAAYVPLDPVYPSERLALMIEDSQMPAVLTQASIAEKLPSHSARTVLLDAHWPKIAAAHQEDSLPPASPDDTAYVIYTSGSTGTPKGVMVSHANAVRLFTSTEQWFGFGPQDVWTLFHSHAFDFSVWELWGALLYGGKLVVVPHWVSRSPEAFHRLLVREEVTVLSQTPSAFYQLIEADLQAPEPSGLRLRLVIFGGEALDIQALQPWIEHHGEEVPRLVNMYGITETTVHVSYRMITTKDLASARSVIGRALPDLQLYLLDSHLEPVPLGIVGEVYVGGAGVAQGYLNRSELTAERFVPDPFGTATGARLYRSGDLARYLPNGDLEYLGRIDQQVKIRGFRIELGEIEAAFVSEPHVAQALVTLREEESGEKRLIAYVVPTPGDNCTSPSLREAAKAKLPDYMVPSLIFVLPAMPLTSNGKIDRRALVTLEQIDSGAREPVPSEPQDEIEKAVAAIWREVLRMDRVGMHDNFFDLGGTSLMMTQVLRRVRDQLGSDLSVVDMFRNPTVSTQAESLRGRAEQRFEVDLSVAADLAKRQKEARRRRRRT